MAKIIVADPLHESGLPILTSAGLDVIDISKDRDKLSDLISDADGLIVRSATKVNSELLSKSKKLKIVARAGVGLDNVDLEKCKELNIQVVNSPEGPTNSVAELSLGLMIALSRKLLILDRETKKGSWPKKLKGRELYGKTLGIIGSGAIGGKLAKYCLFMGMKVIAFDIIKIEELENLDGFEYTDLEDVFENSDIISVHVPLVPATKHLINEKSLDKMKDGVLIVNAARGGVIDELALFNAMKTGKVAGTALDVYEKEPVEMDFELFKMDNVIATPHIGAQTYEASIRNTTIVCEKIVRYFKQ